MDENEEKKKTNETSPSEFITFWTGHLRQHNFHIHQEKSNKSKNKHFSIREKQKHLAVENEGHQDKRNTALSYPFHLLLVLKG